MEVSKTNTKPDTHNTNSIDTEYSIVSSIEYRQSSIDRIHIPS